MFQEDWYNGASALLARRPVCIDPGHGRHLSYLAAYPQEALKMHSTTRILSPEFLPCLTATDQASCACAFTHTQKVTKHEGSKQMTVSTLKPQTQLAPVQWVPVSKLTNQHT